MTIKNSWTEITLREYQELLNIKDSVTLNDFEKDLEIILLISDITRQELNDMPVSELKSFTRELKFLDTIPEAEVKQYYKVKGREYRFVNEVKDIKTAQFVDLMELVKDKSQINSRLHEILAVVLIPVKKRKWWQVFSGKHPEKYMETPHEHTAYNLLELPAVDALAISNFFFALSTRFVETSLSYSIDQKNKILKQVLNNLNRKKNRTGKETKAMEQIRDLLNNTNGFTT